MQPPDLTHNPRGEEPRHSCIRRTGTARRSLIDAFAAAAAAHADRTAIEEGERSVSYRQLDELAQRVALRLTHARVAPGRRVALLLDPGIDAVATMLATLRIGCAYVPLDPADPPERLKTVLRDAEPEVLVTSAELARSCRALAAGRIPVLLVQETGNERADAAGGGAAAAVDVAGSPPPVTADTVAFVLYTSGSTGEPKGVLQTHGNLVHAVGQHAATLGIAPSDRHSMLYSLSFAASSMDVYGTLLNGATLCFFNARRLGVAPLAGWIEEKRITVLHMVPSLFRHLAGRNHSAPARFASVRAIALGGEMVTPSDVDLWREHFPADSMLVNQLAATEVGVMAQYVVPRDGTCDGAVPAGLPVKDVAIAILRADGSQAAAGEAGEVVVSSPYISPGYWRRAELTASTFADDPSRPGWRQYRSGDVGMWTTDGVLVVLGRRDAVVKVRGHSVHLAEVEAALRRDADVQDAAVIASTHEDARRGARLVAYVAPGTVDGASLRRRLASRLPGYAVPSLIRPFDALPQTSTGKIDRRALESGLYDRTISSTDRPEVANPVEREVAAIFAGLLKCSNVDRTDDFFDLGGDSLLLLELQDKLQRAFGREVQAEDVLRDASVAAVAALVGGQGASAPAVEASEPDAARLISLRTSGSATPLMLVHGGGGRAGASPALLDALGDNQPLYGFQARGRDGAGTPHTSIADMAAEYVDLMRQVQPGGPYFIGSVCAGAFIALEMAQRLRDAGETVAPLLLIDPPTPHWSRSTFRSLITRTGLAIAAGLLDVHPTRWLAVRLILWRIAGRRSQQSAADAPPELQVAPFRVRVQFSRAAYRYRPRPYDGPVDIIASRDRIRHIQSGHWDGILKGPVRTFEAGLRHKDVFAPGNADTAQHVRRCVDDAQRWIRQIAGRDDQSNSHEVRQRRRGDTDRFGSAQLSPGERTAITLAAYMPQPERRLR